MKTHRHAFKKILVSKRLKKSANPPFIFFFRCATTLVYAIDYPIKSRSERKPQYSLETYIHVYSLARHSHETCDTKNNSYAPLYRSEHSIREMRPGRLDIFICEKSARILSERLVFQAPKLESPSPLKAAAAAAAIMVLVLITDTHIHTNICILVNNRSFPFFRRPAIVLECRADRFSSFGPALAFSCSSAARCVFC